MGLGSRKFSEGSRSLFGSIAIPNLKKSEFADVLRSGVEQISALTRKTEKSFDTPSGFRNSSSGARDLSAYGFENFQVTDDIEVFVHGTTAEESFKNSEAEFKPVVSSTGQNNVVVPVMKSAAIEDFAPKSDTVSVKIPLSTPVKASAAKAKPVTPFVEVPVKKTVQKPVTEEPVKEPIVQKPVEEPVIEAPVEAPVAETPVEEPVVEAPVVEQPKIDEYIDQPMIIRPEIIEDEDAAVEAEEVAIIVDKKPVDEEFEPASLFGNIKRGMSEEVDAHVGQLEDGIIKETGAKVTLEDYDFRQTIEEVLAENAAIDEMEALDAQIREMPVEAPVEEPAEERIMLRPYQYVAEPAEAEIERLPYVERAVPKLEDFIQDETVAEFDITDSFVGYLAMIPEEEPAPAKAVAVIPEWDVTEADAEVFVDYISSIPEESTWAVAPVWDVTEEAVDAFAAYQTIWPQYPKAQVVIPEWDTTAETFEDYLSFIPEESTWAVAPVWEVSDEAVDAFTAYLTIWPQYPKAQVVIPEWDTTAESYAEYLSFIPEESTWTIEPVWDVTEEAVDAFAAYQTIRPEYPRRVAVIPEWDTTAESYADYLSFIPEESTWIVAPVWDVTDEAVEAFAAYQTIRPEYPRRVAVIPEWDTAAESYAEYLSFIPEESTWTIEPVWEVSDEAVEAFAAYQTIRPEYPKAVAVIPEWDVTDAAVAGFEGYRTAEEDYFNQSMMVVATTVSVSRIEIDAIEKHISDAVAAASGVTGNYAETTGSSDLQIKIKDNTDFNQENLQVVPELTPEKKVRTSRFVFKDGRLQKITEEISLDDIETTVVDMSATVSEDVTVEEMPEVEEKTEVFSLPAAQAYAALPAPVAKSTEGVRFSFGQSKNSYGSVSFYF